MKKNRKEIDLTGTKIDNAVRKTVAEAKAIAKEGPMCPDCHNRVTRCTCDGA